MNTTNASAKVNGNTFRRIIKAAITVTGGSIPINSYVFISINDNTQNIKVKSCNLEHGFKAVIPAKSEGYADFVLSDTEVKRLLNIKGDDITVLYSESGEHSEISFTDGKKKMTFNKNVFDPENWINMDDDTYSTYADFEAADFMEAVNRSSIFVSQSDRPNPILKGFCINGDQMETLDGYRAFICKLPGMYYNAEKFVISGSLKNIKNIFDKSEHIVLDKSKKYVKFSTTEGVYIEYVVRLLNGEFHDLSKCVPKNYTAKMTVNAETLKAICKEAKSYVNNKAPVPIILKAEHGNGKMVLPCSDFKYEEAFEADDYSGVEMFAGYKAAYFYDGLNAFSGNVNIEYSGKLMPLVISQNNDLALVLPIRLDPETEAAC